MRNVLLFTFFFFWILWQRLQVGIIIEPSWDYKDSFDTRIDCDNRAAFWIETLSKNPAWKGVLAKSKNRLRFLNEDGRETTLEYICAPDSVDPRSNR